MSSNSTIAAIPLQSVQLSMTNFVYGTLPDHIMRYSGCYYQYKQVEVSLDGAGNVNMIKPINNYVTSASHSCEIYTHQSEADVIFVNLLFRKTTRVELGSTINVIRLLQHSIAPIHLTTIHCTISSFKKKDIVTITPDVLDLIVTHLSEVPIHRNGVYAYVSPAGHEVHKLSIHVTNVTAPNPNAASLTSLDVPFINSSTIIHAVTEGDNVHMPEATEATEGPIFKGHFQFNKLDIGGLDSEFVVIFRRAFTSRIMPPEIRKTLGIKDIKGIMMHGPPGCGKTLIARKLAEVINSKTLQIVTGPSLIHGLIGKSEENVRDLFATAKADWAANPNTTAIHVIIVDECDAIFKRRGGSSGGAMSNVNDNMVNQFLSMIDGPESIGNILLICMTNDLKSIDPAIIRPGRIELLLEIKLPTFAGRRDIFHIHLRKIKDGHVSEDVHSQMDSLIARTANFTGAEIEGVVENAKSYAMSRIIDAESDNLAESICAADFHKIVVTHDDLMRSIGETVPAFGSKSHELSIILKRPLSLDLTHVRKAHFNLHAALDRPTLGSVVSTLLIGPIRCGKTTLACHVANEFQCGCIRFVNIDTLSAASTSYLGRAGALYNIITELTHPTEAILILDSIETLIGYSCLGHQYNNDVLQHMYAMLGRIIETTKNIRVIMTSSNEHLMDVLGLKTAVTHCIYMDRADDAIMNSPLDL